MIGEIRMRDVERLLVGLNIAGSLVQGWRGDPTWLLLSAAGFAGFVILADRALRRRIGPRAWPSEGYARFTFNTNLYFSLVQLALGALLFLAAHTLAGRLAG
jgi:hypothetical protein